MYVISQQHNSSTRDACNVSGNCSSTVGMLPTVVVFITSIESPGVV